jgi:hypothetical protein
MLDADHPSTGVNLPRRNTMIRGRTVLQSSCHSVRATQELAHEPSKISFDNSSGSPPLKGSRLTDVLP